MSDEEIFNEWKSEQYKDQSTEEKMEFVEHLHTFPLVARKHLPYGQKEWVWDCMWGSGFTISQLKGRDYLWKEIVLPKEIKEND